jgi:lipid II:glycine glycyltransferase (peptidoglycan interpeptide bridge formation enzyme)
MREVSLGYSAEIDCISQDLWYEILAKFRDANLYQTWAYNLVRAGKGNVSTIVLKRNKEIVAAAQARLVKIPGINIGIAYIRWGPLWRRRESDNTIEDFREMIVSLRKEYVDRRGLFLRIIPNETERCQDELRPVFESLGFQWHNSNYRTLYLPLTQTLEEIRNNMSKTWRKHLNRAENKGLTVIEGADRSLFDIVDRLYRETVLRKGFLPGISVGDYRMLVETLPKSFKMKIMVCQSEGQAIAALVGSAIGDVGIELIAATGSNGLDLGGSYLLRWRMIEYFKRCGCCFYDLNGINPEKNPGGYQFKSGLCGKNGLDLHYLGAFEACKNPLSLFAVRLGEKIRRLLRSRGYE